MRDVLAQQGRFWRYNYAVLAGTGYWILAVPVAVSQVVTLWMMAMASGFGQPTANRIAELMTPILGAFLVAHSLAPEYRSGVGAVLASKPVSLSRVLSLRVGLGMLLALTLTVVSLTACSMLLQPIQIWQPLLASVPSLWFLSTLALLFATIFRSPLGGFAVALAIWALDFSLGYGVHPLLSVQGYSAANDQDLLAGVWTAGKGAQLIAGMLLWHAHGRQLPRICRPPERNDILKMVAACLGVVAFYCATGAAAIVSYGYSSRGQLPQSDAVWFRRTLGVYGPIPVASLFGPAFGVYVSDPPAAQGTAATSREARLKQALQRWPNSIWAPSIAFDLGALVEKSDPSAVTRQYLVVVDRYGSSPYAPRALQAIIRIASEAGARDDVLLAARRLMAEYSTAQEVESAAEGLDDLYPERVQPAEMLKGAQLALAIAPAHRKPSWLLRCAEVEETSGQREQAMAHARQAREDAIRLQEKSRDGSDEAKELMPHVARLGSNIGDADKLIARLSPR